MSITEQYTNENIIRRSLTVRVPIDRAFKFSQKNWVPGGPGNIPGQVMYWK